MILLANALRLIGGSIVAVSILHITLGPSAEVLLGSGISETSMADATLDSQNRFYGAAFSLFGVIFIFCASDIERYREIVFITLGVFFVAGLARVISIVFVGFPTWPVVVLLGSELLIPPLLYLWMRKELGKSRKSDA